MPKIISRALPLVVALAACSCGGGGASSLSTGTGEAGEGGQGGQGGNGSGGASTSANSSGSGGTADPGSGGSNAGGSNAAGAGGASASCPDPLRGFSPSATYAAGVGPAQDETIGGFFAKRLPGFDVDTTCSFIVIGLENFSNPAICSIPQVIELAAWSEAGTPGPFGGLLPTSVPTTTAIPTASYGAELIPGGLDAWMRAYHVPGAWHFQGGLPAFVAVRLVPALCVASLLPSCDETNDLRYRPVAPGQGWQLLSHPKDDAPAGIPAIGEQLMIGLADCHPA